MSLLSTLVALETLKGLTNRTTKAATGWLSAAGGASRSALQEDAIQHECEANNDHWF